MIDLIKGWFNEVISLGVPNLALPGNYDLKAIDQGLIAVYDSVFSL